MNPVLDSNSSASLLGSLLQSLVPLLIGYIPAVLIGSLIGIAVGWNRVVYAIVKRVLQIPAAMPAIALLPLVLFMVQSNQPLRILAVVHGAVWWIALYTAAAVQIWRQQRNPSAAIASFGTGLRFGMAMAWASILVVEFLLAGVQGIGFALWNAYQNADFNQVMRAALIIGVVGFLLDQAIDLLTLLVTGLMAKRPNQSP